jgi:glyoxylase-like metal-dependent hydrolase (beta-lactamase superfamily II)
LFIRYFTPTRKRIASDALLAPLIFLALNNGGDASHFAPLKKRGIDILILSHCHIDHRLTYREIPDVPVWCHEAEAIFLNDRNLFYNGISLPRNVLNLTGSLGYTDAMLGIEISRYFDDEDRIDLGGINLETIHTPGHTPGHLAFFIPEADLLFAADVELTSFNPFYGHDFADIEDFLQCIVRLKQQNASIVATGHTGPFSGQVNEKLKAYEEIFYHCDRMILVHLNQPRTLGDFLGLNLIFRAYPDFPDLMRWFELVHIEKHLDRLKTMGKFVAEKIDGR